MQHFPFHSSALRPKKSLLQARPTSQSSCKMTISNVFADAFEQNNGKGIKDSQISDYWLEKGDYVNLEYISLGYNWNKERLNCKYLSNVRLALSCNNVMTFTGYSGLTPLINSTSFTNGYLGMDDKQIYPLNRTFSVSLGVTF